MKNKIKLLSTVFSFVFVGAVFAPLAGQAAALETSAAAVDSSGSESKVVTGHVTAKSDSNLTVNGDSIAVTGATACIKDAAAIGLAEVKVGDEVRVAVAKSVDGTLQALSVEVLKAAE